MFCLSGLLNDLISLAQNFVISVPESFIELSFEKKFMSSLHKVISTQPKIHMSYVLGYFHEACKLIFPPYLASADFERLTIYIQGLLKYTQASKLTDQI